MDIIPISDESDKIYDELVNEITSEIVENEIFCKKLRKSKSLTNFSVLQVCSPFWMTKSLFNGFRTIFRSLKPSNICRNILNTHHVAIEIEENLNSIHSIPNIMTAATTISRDTEITNDQVEQNNNVEFLQRVGSQLCNLVNFKKFRNIVPANRRHTKRLISPSPFNRNSPKKSMTELIGKRMFKAMNDRNCHRYGGKIMKSKLPRYQMKIRNSCHSDGSAYYDDIDDIMEHILYMPNDENELDEDESLDESTYDEDENVNND